MRIQFKIYNVDLPYTNTWVILEDGERPVP